MMATPGELGLQSPGATGPGPGPVQVVEDQTFYAWDGNPETMGDEAAQSSGVPGDPLAWLLPGGGQDSRPASPPQSQWDVPENPYRQQVEALQRQGPTPAQRLQAEVAGYARDRDQYRAILSTPVEMGGAGMDPQQAQVVTDAAFAVAVAQARQASVEAVTQPAAKTQVAQILADRYSTPQFQISPGMLTEETTPTAMEARAKTIAGFARHSAFTSRAAGRVDAVEAGPGSGTGSGVDLNNASPFEMIRAGLRTSRGRA